MGNSDAPSGYRANTVAALLRFAFPLLGVFLMTLGTVGTVSYGILPLFDALRSRNWQPVGATLEEATLEPQRSALHPPLERVSVRYRYMFDSVEYVGGRLDPQEGLYPHRRAKDVIERLRAKPQLEVWVNPANPRDALVQRELRVGVALFALPAFGMAVAGGISLFAGMLVWNNLPTPVRRRRIVGD